MADTKYSALGAGSALGGTEIWGMDQGGTSLGVTAAQVRTYVLAPGTDVAAAAYTWCKITADYTLTSTTSAQKLFNASTTGALTLATGVYFFECGLYLTTMSSTSGNGQFQVLGGGSATVTNVLYFVTGIDNTTPLAVGTQTGSASVTSSGAVSMVTAATGTGLTADITGTFEVTGTGSIIPSIALVTAAAAVVKAGSFFKCWRAAATGTTSVGSWS